MRAAAGLALGLALLAGTPALADEPVLEMRIGSVSLFAAPADITEVAPVDSYEPGLMLGFSPEFARQIAKLTGANIGQEAQLLVCGKLLLAPIIQEQISGGRILLSPISAPSLQGYLMALTGEAPCPDQ